VTEVIQYCGELRRWNIEERLGRGWVRCLAFRLLPTYERLGANASQTSTQYCVTLLLASSTESNTESPKIRSLLVLAQSQRPSLRDASAHSV
jgi:hypothetical protein